MKQSDGCGEERPAVPLLPALRLCKSRAEGAASGLHRVVRGWRELLPMDLSLDSICLSDADASFGQKPEKWNFLESELAFVAAAM